MISLTEIFNLSDHNQNLDFLFNKSLFLAKTLPSPIPFVEIGTRAGGTTMLFIEAIIQSGIPRLIFSIDPYGNKPFLQGTNVLYDLYGESFWKQAAKNIADLCFTSKLVFHSHWKITSLDFTHIYDNISIWHEGKIFKGPFGLVYLDGDHDETSIAMELSWFIPRLHANGCIIVDDSEHIINSKDKTISLFTKNSFPIGNRLYSGKVSI